MTIGPVHHFKPSDQYNRLLEAFDLEQNPENNRTYLTILSDLLDIPMRTFSDCIRRGYVTQPVLDAAEAKGINPDYIRSGALPMHLEIIDLE